MRLPHWAIAWGLLTVAATATGAEDVAKIDDCLNRLAASCAVPPQCRFRAAAKVTSQRYVRTTDLEVFHGTECWQTVVRAFGIRLQGEQRLAIHEVRELILGRNPFVDETIVPPSAPKPPGLRVMRMSFETGNQRQDRSMRVLATPVAQGIEWQPLSQLGVAAVLFGVLPGDEGLPLWEIARQDAERRVAGTPLLDGQETIQIVADTRFGKRTMWLDPRFGYLPRRIECTRASHHSWNRKTVQEWSQAAGIFVADVPLATEMVFSDFRLQEIEGRPRIVGFRIRYHAPIQKSSETQEFEGAVEMSDWDVSTGVDLPLTLKTGSQVPVGTPVDVDGRIDRRFEWNGGAVGTGAPLNVVPGAIRLQ